MEILAVLKANGIEYQKGSSTLLPIENDAATQAFLEHKLDAVFLSGESVALSNIRKLMHAEGDGVRLYDFPQADAYVQRFAYLSKLQLPAGAFDLGNNIPPQPLTLLAPTVELIARSDLHPALVDLLIEASSQAPRNAMFQKPGEFPAPSQHGYPLSDEADRYYKSGKGLVYRYLPFWLASLVNRLLVILVPALVVLLPGLQLVPRLYAWRVKRRIYQDVELGARTPAPRTQQALAGVDRQRQPDQGKTERARSAERLVEQHHADQQLQGRTDVLAYADGRVGNAPRAVGEQGERQRRHHAADDEPEVDKAAGMAECAAAVELCPDQVGGTDRRDQQGFRREPVDRLDRHGLDEITEARLDDMAVVHRPDIDQPVDADHRRGRGEPPARRRRRQGRTYPAETAARSEPQADEQAAPDQAVRHDLQHRHGLQQAQIQR